VDSFPTGDRDTISQGASAQPDRTEPATTTDEPAHVGEAGPTAPAGTQFYDRAGGGGSSAILVGYSDGLKRVTKLRGNPQKDVVLVNELIVARLAARLGAPCPPGRVVLVGAEIVEAAKKTIPELATALAGPSFGRDWIEGTFNPTEATSRDSVNRAELGGLILLYAWTRNSDCKGEHLLWRISAEGQPEVFGFDHGHCFDYEWDESIRDRASEIDIRGRLQGLPQLLSAASAGDFDPFLESIRDLTRADIDDITADVPGEWGVGVDLLVALADYLDTSREALIEDARENLQAMRRE
jgi:hypothetical protein